MCSLTMPRRHSSSVQVAAPPCILQNKHDLVEPVVFRGGCMTAATRNEIYASHNLPGIGKRVILSEDEKKQRKVVGINRLTMLINFIIEIYTFRLYRP